MVIHANAFTTKAAAEGPRDVTFRNFDEPHVPPEGSQGAAAQLLGTASEVSRMHMHTYQYKQMCLYTDIYTSVGCETHPLGSLPATTYPAQHV